MADLPSGGIAELTALIDPAWIEQALCATGKASIRRRKLPADSHELLDAKLGDYHCGELTLAAGLSALNHSITLFDRAYFSAAFLLDWQQGGAERHWLMRARDNIAP